MWEVEYTDEFGTWWGSLRPEDQDRVAAAVELLEAAGPSLGRPLVDTITASSHANMKELRFSAADGEWRVAFAFDIKRKAILLVAGDKSGVHEKRFYRELIREADDRFDAHLARLEQQRQRK